jgi:hypothetical protein
MGIQIDPSPTDFATIRTLEEAITDRLSTSSDDSIEALAIALFGFESIDDLTRWLDEQA